LQIFQDSDSLPAAGGQIEGSHLYLALVCVNLFSKSTNVIVGSGIKGYGDTKWMFFTQIFANQNVEDIINLQIF